MSTRTLTVLQPGMSTTVQDLGRAGHAAMGVAVAGAADPLSLRVGNRLVGNDDGAAALEFTLLGGVLRIDDDVVVALTGAPLSATVEDPHSGARPLPRYAATRLGAGALLRLGGSAWGVRAYLCVQGGIDTPLVLGSRATHTASGLGGLHGGPLRANDQLPIGAGAADSRPRALDARTAAQLDAWLRQPVLRTTDAAHTALFSASARAALWRDEFAVSTRCDRAGARLLGPPLQPPGDGVMPSEGMPLGALQMPSAGEVIILLYDGPTTGGYPTIATVATIDHARLGQLRPHEKVRFTHVHRDEARALFGAQTQWLAREIPPA